MISFARLLKTATLHKGGKKQVQSLLPDYLSNEELIQQSDAFYLNTMSRRIFRAGLKHSVVDAKWPAFEKAFKAFNPLACAYLNDDDINTLMQDTSIIRHLGKIRAVRTNANMIYHLSEEYGGFGTFLANWRSDEIVELWIRFKKEGAQLGGLSGPRFLRMAGKDSFVLTDDVVSVLKAHDILNKNPTSQRDLRDAQAAFNQWHKESGLPYCHMSRIVSFTAT